MRVSRPVSLILLLFGALLAYPSEALACSCAAGMPLCESFWKTPVVFSGEALEIKKIPNHLGSEYPPDRLVTFRVHEAWRGGVSGVIEVHTGGGLGDCGFDFQAGRRYLVFAHESKSQLSTGICSPTKLLDEATADLAYIRQPFAPSAGGRIYGTATYTNNNRSSNGPGTSRPAVRYTVTLRSERREWRTTTNDEGQYEFTGMPAGTYELQLAVPTNEQIYGATTVELADPRGCAKADLYVFPR